MANDNFNDYFEDGAVEMNRTQQKAPSNSTQSHSRNRNLPIIILLSCLLFVGGLSLGIQIFSMLRGNGGGSQTEQQNGAEPTPYTQWFGGSGTGDESGGAPDGGLLTRKDENGNTMYSTDGGKTWSETQPAGFGESGDDSHYYQGDNVPDQQGPMAGSGQGGLMTRHENGKAYYSTDGGQTWSETPPSGFNNTP